MKFCFVISVDPVLSVCGVLFVFRLGQFFVVACLLFAVLGLPFGNCRACFCNFRACFNA